MLGSNIYSNNIIANTNKAIILPVLIYVSNPFITQNNTFQAINTATNFFTKKTIPETNTECL